MPKITFEPYSTIGSTPKLEKYSKQKIALSPVAPLIADTGTWDSVNILRITNYQEQRVVGQISILHSFHTLLFSPNGKYLLAEADKNVLVIYSEPWNSPQVIYENQSLYNIFDSVWLDKELLLLAGIANGDQACISVFNVKEQTMRIVLEDNPHVYFLLGNRYKIDEILCSRSGLVAFICYLDREKRAILYQLNKMCDAILSKHSFLINNKSYQRSQFAIAEDGQTILYKIEDRIYLFDREGLQLEELATSPSSNHALFHDGIVCLNAFMREKTFYKVREKRFHFWCSLQSTSYIADLTMRDEKMLVALEGEDQTSVLELTDFDLLQLASDKPIQRREAVKQLAERKVQSAVPKLIYLLDDEDLGVQHTVVYALAVIGDPTALPHLIRTFGRKPSDRPYHRIDILCALRRFPMTQLAAAVSQCVARPGVFFHRGAVRVLEDMPSIDLFIDGLSSIKVVEILCQEVCDRDRGIQIAAAHALLKRADIRACPTLLGYLNDGDKDVRMVIQQAVMRTLRVVGLLSEDVSNQLSLPIDISTYAQEMISTGRTRGFMDSETPPAGIFLVALAGACVQNNQSLPQLLNAIDMLAGNEVFQASAAIGLSVAVICAAALVEKQRWQDAIAFYQDAIPLAKQIEAPQMEWRAWDAIGQCFVVCKDDLAALTAFRGAVDVIDRLWFDLLEEDKLRGFFGDKALLYDRASLCALRLGYEAQSLEYLEKAKTRYLGDLIARHEKKFRTDLDQERKEFWDNIGHARSIRVAVSSPQIVIKERVEIISISWGRVADGDGTIQPERLIAFEEAASEQKKELQRKLGVLRDIWQLMAYLSSDNVISTDQHAQHVQNIESVYEALLPIYQAVKSAALPLSEKELDDSINQFNDAAEVLRRGGQEIREAKFWIFSEYKNLWSEEIRAIGNSIEAGETALFLEAAMEALNIVVDKEAVFGSSTTSPNGQEQEGLICDFLTFSQQRPSPNQRTTIAKTRLEQHEQTRWRYHMRIIRGEITPYHEIADTLRGQPNVAQLEFAVTESGTVIYVAHGLKDWGRQSEEIATLRGENSLSVFTCPEVTLSFLDQLFADWLTHYQLIGQGGLQAWMGVMEQVLQQLYTYLIAPLEAHLKQRGVKHLRIIPHRALHLIPFSALHRVSRGRCHFLGDDYDIEYAPSATIQHICRERAKDRPAWQSLTAVANPTNDLPFAASEVKRVSTYFPASAVQMLSGNKAHLEIMKSFLPCSVFHFAGHGHYEWTDPLASYLRFAKSEELSLASLFNEAIQLPETSLVVLSACETNITDPKDLADEYLGLASGFLFAGTPWVLSTLWAVNDISTSLLMSRFYQYHFKDGLSPSRALQEAQYWLREKVSRRYVVHYIQEQLTALEMQRELVPSETSSFLDWQRQIERLKTRLEQFTKKKYGGPRPFAHPYYWAAFTLSGGGTLMEEKQ